MAFNRYVKQATRVAVKYNSPRLLKEVWSSELGIPEKKFEGLPSMFSWGQAIAYERGQKEAKKK